MTMQKIKTFKILSPFIVIWLGAYLYETFEAFGSWFEWPLFFTIATFTIATIILSVYEILKLYKEEN